MHWQLTFETASWYDWAWYASYAPHGPVHFLVGGYGDCGDLAARVPSLSASLGATARDGVPVTATEAANHTAIVDSFKLGLISVPKNLWKYHLVESPAFCSSDTPQAECYLICDEAATNASFVARVMGDQKVNLGAWSDAYPEDAWRELVAYICATPFTPGEHIEAASPADVSFWPIHPTLERLLQYKRARAPFVNASWTNPVGAYTRYCAYDTDDEHNCVGHHPTDLLLWDVSLWMADADAAGDDAFASSVGGGSFETRRVTNGEFFELSNPANLNYSLPYVYDNFEWDHCAAAGWAFEPQSEMAAAALARAAAAVTTETAVAAAAPIGVAVM